MCLPGTQSGASLGSRLTVLPWHLVLMYPLDHSLVPPHRLATPGELRELQQRYGLVTHNHHHHRRPAVATTTLPALRADDPVAQYLGLAVGDVVRIDRADGSVFYRAVITAR